MEEIADVDIMIEQMKVFMDCKNSVRETVEEKLNRQIDRIISIASNSGKERS